MKFISVMPAPGRVAVSAPRGGYQFQAGSYTTLPETPWLRMLIEKHGDLVERPVEAEAPKADAAPIVTTNKPAQIFKKGA